MSSDREFVLTLSCRDTKGIVYSVSGLLYEAGCNMLDSHRFGGLTNEHRGAMSARETVFFQ